MIRLIRFEFYKLFCKRSILVILLVFSVINLFKIQNEFQSYSYLADKGESKSWSSVYWQLYEEYNGEMTMEKIDKLLALYHPLKEATADMTASTATDNPNTMTGNIYSDRNLLDKYYVEPMEQFYNYESLAEEVVEKARENVSIYEEKGQEYEVRKNSVIYNLYSGREILSFSYREMYNYYLNYDFSTVLILLLCLYGIVGTFVCEKETQMNMLLLTNPKGGKQTVFSKVIAVSLFVMAVSLWFSALDYIGFTLSFGTAEGYDLPIYAIQNFSTSSVSWNLCWYSVVSALVRALGAWYMGMLFLLISMLGCNALIPFVSGFGLGLCLILLGDFCSSRINVWMKIINPYSLLTNRILFGKTEFINVAGYPVLSCIGAFFWTVFVGILIIAVIMILSAKNVHCHTIKNWRKRWRFLHTKLKK